VRPARGVGARKSASIIQSLGRVQAIHRGGKKKGENIYMENRKQRGYKPRNHRSSRQPPNAKKRPLETPIWGNGARADIEKGDRHRLLPREKKGAQQPNTVRGWLREECLSKSIRKKSIAQENGRHPSRNPMREKKPRD